MTSREEVLKPCPTCGNLTGRAFKAPEEVERLASLIDTAYDYTQCTTCGGFTTLPDGVGHTLRECNCAKLREVPEDEGAQNDVRDLRDLADDPLCKTAGVIEAIATRYAALSRRVGELQSSLEWEKNENSRAGAEVIEEASKDACPVCGALAEWVDVASEFRVIHKPDCKLAAHLEKWGKKEWERCENCGGQGEVTSLDALSGWERCPACNGTGEGEAGWINGFQ